jgi:RNA polymerase primary sigma factor
MARKKGETKKILGEEGKNNHPRTLPVNGNPHNGRRAADYKPEPSENLLWAYMKEVGRISLLNREEERTLTEEIQKGERELVHRLLKLELTIDELGMIRKKEWNISDELITAIMRELKKLEEEKRVPRDQRILVSEIKSLYSRLMRFKAEMLKRNLRLVIKIAKGYMHTGMSLLDLVQEGNLGLMKAIAKFNSGRGYRFSTYATWWIRHSIQRAIVEKERTIRIPVHLIEKRQRVTKTYTSLAKKHGNAPALEEVAEKARVPVEVVQKALFSLPKAISLETPVGEDSSLGYFIEDERSPSPLEVMERKEIRQMAKKILFDLPPRQAEILRLRFGIGGGKEHTLEEIGRKFGISRERVRQLEKKGINRLRHYRENFSSQVDSPL